MNRQTRKMVVGLIIVLYFYPEVNGGFSFSNNAAQWVKFIMNLGFLSYGTMLITHSLYAGRK